MKSLCLLNKTIVFKQDLQLVARCVLFCLQTSEKTASKSSVLLINPLVFNSTLSVFVSRSVHICLIARPATFCPDVAEKQPHKESATSCRPLKSESGETLPFSYNSLVTYSDVTERRHVNQYMLFARVLSLEAADVPYDWFYLKGALYLTGLSAPRVKEEHFCDRV